MHDRPEADFERAAQNAAAPGVVGELWLLLRQNRKWWLAPLLVALLLLGLLLVLSTTAAAPFLYTLF